MQFTDYFSSDYVTARRRFLLAASELGGQATKYPFDVRGPADEPLVMDAVRFGPEVATRLVIVSSGLHGVEGFFGSAVQLAWLKERAARWQAAPETGLLMVHALNPYGFAWRRRWNEHNVDLNRNFLDDGEFPIEDPAFAASRSAYARLNALLNPASPPARFEPYMLNVLLRMLSAGYAARQRLVASGAPAPPASAIGAIAQLGLAEFRKTLPVGQYDYPQGIFYGGSRPEQTVRIVREALPQWVAGARDVVHLDFHTGLGRYGNCELLLVDQAGSPHAQWIERRFGAESVVPRGDRTAYIARGQMTQDIRRRLTDLEYYGITAEFGTYSAPRVLRALRAENQAHHYSDHGSPGYRRAKLQLLEAFCPADTRWRNRCVARGLELIDRALSS